MIQSTLGPRDFPAEKPRGVFNVHWEPIAGFLRVSIARVGNSTPQKRW